MLLLPDADDDAPAPTMDGGNIDIVTDDVDADATCVVCSIDIWAGGFISMFTIRSASWSFFRLLIVGGASIMFVSMVIVVDILSFLILSRMGG